jgi:spermidine/putrescine transport system permease protein
MPSQNKRSNLVSLLPLVVWLGVFVLLPNLLVLAGSFLRRDESGFVALAWNLDNYTRLADPLYLHVFGHSVLLAALATAICLLLGYPFAYLLARLRPGLRPLLLVLAVVPLWTNSLLRTYAIRSLLAAKGVVNNGLLALGLVDEPIRLLYTDLAVMLGMVYVLLPFMILPLYSAIEKLDWRLVDAAADLGADPLRRFVTVVLPLSLPGVVAGCLLVFMPALGLFFISDVLGGAREMLLGNLLKDQFLDARDWPFGAAASVLLMAGLSLFLAAHYCSRRLTAAEEET